jgi:hypothetical protein
MATANRIMVTTATTGTGALTLSSTGVRSSTNGDCLAPAEVGSELSNRRVPYFITSGNNFASGIGTLNVAGTILTRDTYEKSWDGATYSTTPLNLTGTSMVTLDPRAEDLQASTIGVSIAIRMGAVTL